MERRCGEDQLAYGRIRVVCARYGSSRVSRMRANTHGIHDGHAWSWRVCPGVPFRRERIWSKKPGVLRKIMSAKHQVKGVPMLSNNSALAPTITSSL